MTGNCPTCGHPLTDHIKDRCGHVSQSPPRRKMTIEEIQALVAVSVTAGGEPELFACPCAPEEQR